MTLFTTENRQRNGAGLSYTFYSQHDGLFTEQPWRVVLEIEQQKDQVKLVGVGALEHKHLESLVGFGSLNEGNRIADQLGAQKIHGRSYNFREQNGPFLAHGERFENFELGTFGRFNRVH